VRIALAPSPTSHRHVAAYRLRRFLASSTVDIDRISKESVSGATAVERRITLTDIDRPGEALEVDIIAVDETSLTLAVPNTSVQFRLFRHSRNAPYQGSLGGRSFCFVPLAVDAKKTIITKGSK
jgi:hypothetical protein